MSEVLISQLKTCIETPQLGFATWNLIAFWNGAEISWNFSGVFQRTSEMKHVKLSAGAKEIQKLAGKYSSLKRFMSGLRDRSVKLCGFSLLGSLSDFFFPVVSILKAVVNLNSLKAVIRQIGS